MKLVKIVRRGQVAEGFLEDDRVHLHGSWQAGPADDAPFTLSRMTPAELQAARQDSTESVARADVMLAAPLDPRAKIISVGLNFIEHMAEAGRDRPRQPALFIKTNDAVVGPEEALIAPSASKEFDYEGELTLVVTGPARHVSVDDAPDHVLGYTCFMDGSVRDFQMKHSTSAGKNFWRSSAMGPWIVTADEVPNIATAGMRVRVNSKELQSTSMDKMIFNVAEIIAYCSIWTVLRPGDVITTGTPSGVGLFRDPQIWLRPGDVVDVEIEGVGVLSNRVEAEP